MSKLSAKMIGQTDLQTQDLKFETKVHLLIRLAFFVENRAKKGSFQKLAFGAKNRSLTDFSCNSLISDKILFWKNKEK